MCKSMAVLLLLITFTGINGAEGMPADQVISVSTSPASAGTEQERSTPPVGSGIEQSSSALTPPDGTGIAQESPAPLDGAGIEQESSISTTTDGTGSEAESAGDKMPSALPEDSQSHVDNSHESELSNSDDTKVVIHVQKDVAESSEETKSLKRKITNDQTGKREDVWDVSMKCRDCLCYFATDCNIDRQCETPGSIFGLEPGFEKGDCGPFHISFPFWADALNEKMDIGDAQMEYRWRLCSLDLMCATDAIQKYFQKYPNDCNGDGKVDCLDYAAIHTLGPYGCMVKENMKHWNRVRRKDMLQCMASEEEGPYAKRMRELREGLNRQDIAARKLAELEKNKSTDKVEIEVHAGTEDAEGKTNAEHEGVDEDVQEGSIVHL